jgi:hypothetical protein
MKKVVWKYRLEIVGGMVGAIAGWCYWYFVGCASGTCPISSKPLNSTAYGVLLGILAFSIFKQDNKINNNVKI